MERINLCSAHMSEQGFELKSIKEAFDTNWAVPLGPIVNGYEAIFKVGMCLPSGPYVKEDDVRYIVDIINKTTV